MRTLLLVCLGAVACEEGQQRAACEVYAECCATLAPSSASLCQSQLMIFRNSASAGEADSACQSALDLLRQNGSCVEKTMAALDAGIDLRATGTPSCVPQSFPATTKKCKAATGACLAQADTQAEWDRCFDSDVACGECLDEAFNHCVIGTPGAPGRCAMQAACYGGCEEAQCGAMATDACASQASTGACATQWDAYERCVDPKVTANKTCGSEAYDTCIPRVASNCGNGVVDSGETCDGNCPTCPTPSDPCIIYEQFGSAATCNIRCMQTPKTVCGTMCPINSAASPSSAIGASVFTGSFMERADTISVGACSFSGVDAAYVWRAPANGQYTFTFDSRGEYYSNGIRTTRSTTVGQIAIVSGHTCGSGTKFACGGITAKVILTADQEVLVVASRTVDTTIDTYYDITAPYTIGISQCTPNCTNKVCGDDGCGGSCGPCASNQTCIAGKCECAPNCSGKQCGPNGCGGMCGTCALNQSCSAGGQCICTPNCSGKTCGSDGCSGSCGTCGLGTSCSGGTCVADPDACDPVGNLGCMAPNECILLSAGEQTKCVLVGTGTTGSFCSASVTCDGGYGCFAGTCRKICKLSTGAGCTVGQVCNGVTGWFTYGACATP